MDIKEKIKNLPAKTGIYLMKNKEGRVIYIGKAKDIRKRVSSYFLRTADTRYTVKFLISKMANIDCIVTTNEKEAIILEDTLLKKYKPRYNIRLKDDKTYINIKLTLKDKYPRILLTRQVRKDGSRYFGPYASSSKVRETLQFLRKIFPMRICSDSVMHSRKRPCIDYQIKICLAPCLKLVTEEDYRNVVNSITMFLEGRSTELIKDLKHKMEDASNGLEFEKAAVIRDRIDAIEATLEKQLVVSHTDIDQDIFGIIRKGKDFAAAILNIRNGRLSNSTEYFFTDMLLPTDEAVSSLVTQYYSMDRFIPDDIILPELHTDFQPIEDLLTEKKGRHVRVVMPKKGNRFRLLQMAEVNADELLNKKYALAAGTDKDISYELQSRFRLKNTPDRIEAFDISNISGKLAVGAMVVFIDGKPFKENYRLYRIKTLDEPDDYGMMKEVLSRRYGKVKDGSGVMPDLIIIDGGKGQLNVCASILKELGIKGIDVLAIAKDKTGSGGEKIYLPEVKDPVILKPGSDIDLFLRAVRDEVHRLAIRYHKGLRKKGVGSVLEEIIGIGKKRAKDVLTYFGSIEKVKEASVEDILKIKGITRQTAEEIKEMLN